MGDHVYLDELIPEKSLCDRYGKTDRWARKGRAEGTMPPHMRIGGTVFYRMADVLAWEAQRVRAHRAAELAAS